MDNKIEISDTAKIRDSVANLSWSHFIAIAQQNINSKAVVKNRVVICPVRDNMLVERSIYHNPSPVRDGMWITMLMSRCRTFRP